MKKPVNDSDEYDGQIENLHQLIQNMSLKKPSMALQNRLGYKESVRSNSRLREYLVAMACLVVGIIIGRVLPEFGSTNGEVAAKRIVESGGLSRQQEPKTAADPATTIPQKSNVRLIDEGLFLLNGEVPVRKYTSIQNRNVTVVDPDTGRRVEFEIPIRKTVVTPAVGT